MVYLYRTKLKVLLQQRLAASDTLFSLSCIGIIVGIASGLAMVIMHKIIVLIGSTTLEQGPQDYENLSPYLRAIIPIGASFLLILLMIKLPKKFHNLGIVYVMERLNYHNANLSFRNALVQFVAAIIGLAGGLSIGKEGPAVHIGSTFGSKLAEHWKLSLQSKETLIACGAAGAISAAFQTPLAGVLFALEVIFLGFQSATILPVILSSVFAMIVSQTFLGSISLFHFDSAVTLNLTLKNVAALLCLSISIALLAGLFFQTQKLLWRFGNIHLIWRFLLVGLVTAACAVFVPETLGVGYDSLELLLSGQNLTSLVITVLLLKVLLTGFSIGLGIPGGLIGPTFLIGGLAGIQVSLWYFDTPSIELISLFALLGMATMMATALQAPLAGLIGIIEINHTSNIILPAMLVIGISCVLTRVVLKQDSVFIERLKNHNLSLQNHMNRLLSHYDIEQLTSPLLTLQNSIKYDALIDLKLDSYEYTAIETEWGYALVKSENIKHIQTNEENKNQLIQLDKALKPKFVQIFEKPVSMQQAIVDFKVNNSPFALIKTSKDGTIRLLDRNKVTQSKLKRLS